MYTSKRIVQLDCQVVIHTLGRRYNFCCQGPISNPIPVLDPLAQTTQGMLLDSFCRNSKQTCLTSHRVVVFPGGLGTKFAL